ncbi:MAG: sulfatase-like hydrolase/transferase [Planctomycetota bacterium]
MKSSLRSAFAVGLLLLAACGEEEVPSPAPAAPSGEAPVAPERADPRSVEPSSPAADARGGSPRDEGAERRRRARELGAWSPVPPAVLDRAAPTRRDANLLVVSIPGLRADRVTAGHHHLHGLAVGGLRFANAVSPAPASAEAAAALFLGREPRLASVGSDGAPGLIDRLRDQGRVTAAVAAFPAPLVAAAPPAFRGLRRGFEVFANDPSPEVNAQLVVDRAGALLDQSRGRRWALWVTLPDLARTLEVPSAPGTRPSSTRSELYDLALRDVDTQLGRLLTYVLALGEARRTIVVVHGDHARPLGEDGALESLRADRPEELRVPLLLVAPGLPARTVDAPCSLLDVAPTLVELMGLGSLPAATGRSLLGHLFDEAPAPAGAALVRLRDSSRPGGRGDLALLPDGVVASFDRAAGAFRVRNAAGETLTADDPRVASAFLDLEALLSLAGETDPLPAAVANPAVALRNAETVPARRAAWRALLGAQGRERAESELSRLLADPSPRVRTNAIEFALSGGAVSASLAPAVLAAAESDAPAVRNAALVALAAVEDARALERLRTARDGKDASARGAALLGLGLRGEGLEGGGVDPSIEALVDEGGFRERVLASAAILAVTGTRERSTIESLLVSRVLPEDLETLVWRARRAAGGADGLVADYESLRGEGAFGRRGDRALEAVAALPVDLAWPIWRAASRGGDAARAAAVAEALGDELEAARAVQERVNGMRDLAREGASFAVLAGEADRAFEAARAVGRADWGLVLELSRAAIERGQREWGGKALRSWRQRVSGLAGEAAFLALAERFEALLNADAAPQVKLDPLGTTRFRLERGEAVIRVLVHAGPSGGALFGGLGERTPVLAAAFRQGGQGEPRPVGVRLPPLGILPGESAALYVVIPLEDLEVGGALALVALVDDGRPLDLLRLECRIEK